MGCSAAEIVLDGATGAFDCCYSYAVPASLAAEAQPGCRVTVPFGRGNTERQGMILRRYEDDGDKPLKELLSVIDDVPVLNDEQIGLCRWMREHTFCTHFDAIHAMLPAGLNYRMTDEYACNPEFLTEELLSEDEQAIFGYLRARGETSREKLRTLFPEAEEILPVMEEKEAVLRTGTPTRRMGDLTCKCVRLTDDWAVLQEREMTKRQREIAAFVAELGGISVRELQYFTGVSSGVIDALIKNGIFEPFEKEVFRTPYRLKKVTDRPEIHLTDEQQKAFDGLRAQMFGEKPAVSLLYGVTGSGKTQVFLKLVDAAVDAGKGVIIMVPEIALTPQMIGIFSTRYGDKIAVLHSAMSLGQRMDEYKRLLQGRATVAIGTRSAVFAPIKELSLIVIDEEQEHTYKSEKSPRFHARELAKYRTAYHGGLLCLASATPSVETYSAAKNGTYGLFTLTSRYGKAVLPEVETVDMRTELLAGNAGSISRALYEAIDGALSAGNQAIVLLNRRGHNTYITCPSCGYVATCPNCSISLTYHSANGRLMCHYCGYSEPSPKTCPECGQGNVRFLGVGTQKVEEELRLMFPEARILRMDADSTMTRDAYGTKLTAFANREYDIMLGTQMVAKGLDFPAVTVVGVIGADQATNSVDYRSFERTFSLLTQVVGRAGRGDSAGKAVIQTVDPNASVITLACSQNYDAFYEEEIALRKLMTFPPYCDICLVRVQSSDRALAEETVREIFGKITEMIHGEYSDVRLIILGPTAAAVPKVNKKYRYCMTVKCKDNKRFREMLRKAAAVRLRRDTAVSIDMNPENIV